jgi:hypothetical protein
LNERGDFSCGGQVGEQDLALGFKFNAKGTVDCYEGDIELLPAAGARRREIAFNMIDGDFKLFQGKWSVEEVHFLSFIDPSFHPTDGRIV